MLPKKPVLKNPVVGINHLDLSKILQYENQQVIASFCYKHPEFTYQEGHELFRDLLSWMWLSELRKAQGKKTYLFGPLLILDELWHVFILHTRDYVDFSMNFFGAYYHHEVELPGVEHILQEDELNDFLEDCFDNLDNNWVARRFSDALV